MQWCVDYIALGISTFFILQKTLLFIYYKLYTMYTKPGNFLM